MKINKLAFTNETWIVLDTQEHVVEAVTIVFVFGNIDILQAHNHRLFLKELYPQAAIVGCSTAGNILDDTVDNFEAVAVGISFEKAYVKVISTKLQKDSIAQKIHDLLASMEKENLKHIFLLVPGLINASDIINGIDVDAEITISGGLAGDNYRFENTYLFEDDNSGNDILIVVGFYGESLYASVGCDTGWKEFGATRVVTKSQKNIIYEIDNEPAIELYKRYLGDKIYDLPNSALRFPLSIKSNKNDKNEVISVIMGINEDGSLVYTGNIEEGSLVRLMRTNISNLIDGALSSANAIVHHNHKSSFSLVVSCSARRSVLKQFVKEEIETIQDKLPTNTQIIGFYSYGEIAPFSNELSKTLLHNQTMTITTIYEE